ncbi:MAG: type I DNA topoisomerase [Oligoflexales bacterium]|nr:type I DNA topoisomerase [Oligoflexales bacterium]
MSKSLVIVESPAKVKTINKFLGSQYIVKSSIGHIRDLAKLNRESGTKSKKKKVEVAKTKKSLSPEDKRRNEQKKLISSMGVDPYNGWEASYEILPGKEKVLKALKESAEKVETIYLATDMDREGEAIAWHLMEAIGGKSTRYKRVTFTEITKKAIKEAFDKPRSVNIDRVHAQLARRFLDRVVGYMLSPLLWEKVARGLSAGRVQSVALRLITEREREIHAFKSDEYWQVHADVSAKGSDKFRIELSKYRGETFKASSQKEVDAILAGLNKPALKLTHIDKKPAKSKPSAPYITSTLQQAASVRLGFGVKKTMMIAQRLYEAGYITYMRTDSTNISEEAVQQSRSYIQNQFGDAYLPAQPVHYASDKKAQEAHEAIRPTDVGQSAAQLTLSKEIDSDARRLYELIWRQFVACQMNPAEFDTTSILVQSGDYEFKARGRILRFDGFLRVQPLPKKSEEDVDLPAMTVGQALTLLKLNPSQHFTKPPPRYTEASLVRELEKKGIGRPSTYASIITTIQERGYVKVDGRRFFSLKMGDIVSDRLVENFHDLMDYSFTANMEEDLDKIADGDLDWRKVLDRFYANFDDKLVQAKKNMRGNPPTPVDIACPECSRKMNIRTARTGVFLSCEGYALPPKERCKGTINLISGDQVESFSGGDDDEGNADELRAMRRCSKCDTAMNSYLINEEKKLHICGRNPECSGCEIEIGKFRIKGYEGPTLVCDKCGDTMTLKTGRFGKYFACNAAPECKNTRKLMRNGEAGPPRSDPIHMTELKCEKSDGYFVLRDGASGLFLASSQFPRSRETKKPNVSDLKRHRQELPDKYKYLADAPATDPDGLAAQIRFSRKTKAHTIGSEKDGKPTGWELEWSGTKWVQKHKEK